MVEVYGVDVVRARGHRLVKATHKSTLEVTKEDWLTERGDCIVGVAADKAPSDFSSALKEGLRLRGSKLLVVLYSGGCFDFLLAEGDPSLQLSDAKRMVVRKSSYIDPSTIGIKATKAAADIDRKLVASLKEEKELVVVLAAFGPARALRDQGAVEPEDALPRRVLEHLLHVVDAEELA